MSVQSQPTTPECKHCSEELEDYYTPGFCSEECYHSHKGDKALNLLRFDHRLCASCGRWLKEVLRPPDQWIEDCHSAVEHVLDHGGSLTSVGGELVLDATNAPTTKQTAADSIVGFQTRTKNAETVEKQFQKGTAQRIYQMGTGCECGITDTRDVDKDLQGLELVSVLANYIKRFRELEREGQLEQRIDKDVFLAEYNETRLLEYSLGKAIYGV